MITTQICCKVKVHTPDDDKGKNRHMECMTELLIGAEEQGSNRDLSLAYVNHNIKRDDYGEVQTDGTFSSECLWQLKNFPEERRLEFLSYRLQNESGDDSNINGGGGEEGDDDDDDDMQLALALSMSMSLEN